MISDVETEVAGLRDLGRAALEARWKALLRSPVPASFTPDLLRRFLAYRLQEHALGGLSRDLRDQLVPEQPAKRAARRLRPGNRLVRRWRGRTYVVEATADGLRFEDQTFASLSEIARKITGTRWSGPRFFGLTR